MEPIERSERRVTAELVPDQIEPSRLARADVVALGRELMAHVGHQLADLDKLDQTLANARRRAAVSSCVGRQLMSQEITLRGAKTQAFAAFRAGDIVAATAAVGRGVTAAQIVLDLHAFAHAFARRAVVAFSRLPRLGTSRDHRSRRRSNGSRTASSCRSASGRSDDPGGGDEGPSFRADASAFADLTLAARLHGAKNSSQVAQWVFAHDTDAVWARFGLDGAWS